MWWMWFGFARQKSSEVVRQAGGCNLARPHPHPDPQPIEFSQWRGDLWCFRFQKRHGAVVRCPGASCLLFLVRHSKFKEGCLLICFTLAPLTTCTDLGHDGGFGGSTKHERLYWTKLGVQAPNLARVRPPRITPETSLAEDCRLSHSARWCRSDFRESASSLAACA